MRSALPSESTAGVGDGRPRRSWPMRCLWGVRRLCRRRPPMARHRPPSCRRRRARMAPTARAQRSPGARGGRRNSRASQGGWGVTGAGAGPRPSRPSFGLRAPRAHAVFASSVPPCATDTMSAPVAAAPPRCMLLLIQRDVARTVGSCACACSRSCGLAAAGPRRRVTPAGCRAGR